MRTNQNVEINDYAFEENLKTCKKIEYQFEKIDSELLGMENARYELDNAVDNKEEKRISSAVDQNYTQLKSNLTSISSELDELKQKGTAEGSTLDEKEREIILTKINAYYIELKNKLTNAHALYNDFKNKAKNRLAKQVRNIDTNNQYDEQQLDQIIDEDPEILQKMVKQQVLGKASLKMQYAAQDIVDKCQGIKVLQRNVKELLDMLKEISQIVALQGEQINSIAVHCEAAKTYMASANVNLIQAKKNHKDMRCVF